MLLMYNRLFFQQQTWKSICNLEVEFDMLEVDDELEVV